MSTSIDSLNAFCSTPLDELLRESDATGDTHPPDAVAAAVRLHQHAVERVPAYAKLVDSQTPEDVKGESSSPLNQIPFLDKASYIGVYNLDERSTGGTLDSIDFIHCSSGSTGTPTFWGRAASDELISSVTFEQFFRYNFLAHERSTLCIVAFPLGAWVGGIFTLDCLRFLTLKGYKLTTVAPGNKVADIVNLARKLAPSFQQTVLLGYPPFVKAAVDRGMEDGMDWSRAQTKLVLAGEVVSEEWKQLMGRRCGMEDASRDIVSMYGTADAGCVACETALSGAIRSWASQDRLPTLCQYNPYQRLLELSPHDGTLVLTTLNDSGTGAPLIRYCIGDSGGLRSFSDMVAFLQQHGGQDLLNRFQLGGASDASASKAVRQPFVWVFGRSFWTVSLYGANVYVENIMVAMQQPHVAEHVTSKFILFVEEDENLDKRLAVRVELSKAAASGSEELRALIAREVLSNLRRVNSEYCNYVPPEKQEPVIHLHQMGDPTYFPVGVKHKYTLLH